jgi:hypothetical protein
MRYIAVCSPTVLSVIAFHTAVFRAIAPVLRVADVVIRRYLEEGAKIARDITARYAN